MLPSFNKLSFIKCLWLLAKPNLLMFIEIFSSNEQSTEFLFTLRVCAVGGKNDVRILWRCKLLIIKLRKRCNIKIYVRARKLEIWGVDGVVVAEKIFWRERKGRRMWKIFLNCFRRNLLKKIISNFKNLNIENSLKKNLIFLSFCILRFF